MCHVVDLTLPELSDFETTLGCVQQSTHMGSMDCLCSLQSHPKAIAISDPLLFLGRNMMNKGGERGTVRHH
jgi:hypothetical protein